MGNETFLQSNSPRRGLQLLKVTESTWCLRRPSYLTCSYLLALDDGQTVCIDAGMSSGAEDILAGLEEMKRSPDSITAVLLTHWHNDHSAGAKLLQEKYGAKVYYHKNAAPYFQKQPQGLGRVGATLSRLVPERGPLVLLKGLLKDGPAHQVKADQLVEGGQLLFDRLRVIETHGHTAGHLSFFDQKEGVLFAGDALAVVDGAPRRMARPVTEDLQAAATAILKLDAPEIKVICPGHRWPLFDRVKDQLMDLQRDIQCGDRWPWFG